MPGRRDGLGERCQTFSDEAVADGDGGDGGARVRRELGAQCGNVVGGRAAADAKHGGDLLVRVPRAQQTQDLSFPRRQLGESVWLQADKRAAGRGSEGRIPRLCHRCLRAERTPGVPGGGECRGIQGARTDSTARS